MALGLSRGSAGCGIGGSFDLPARSLGTGRRAAIGGLRPQLVQHLHRFFWPRPQKHLILPAKYSTNTRNARFIITRP